MPHLYIPFSDAEGNQDLRRLADKWLDRASHDIRAKALPTIKIHGSVFDVLYYIRPDETIYVLAHGGEDEYVYSDSKPPCAGMNCNELALRMYRDRLGLGHRKIKLYFCNPLSAPIATFARRFKEEMWQLNFTGALEVYYYIGSVSVPQEDGDTGIYYKTSSHAPMMVDSRGGLHSGRASSMRQRA